MNDSKSSPGWLQAKDIPDWVIGIAALGLCATALAGPAVGSRLADAAEHANRAAVRALLNEHAELNAPQPDGMTALHWAAHLDDLEMARWLVEAGADVRATNRYGVAPLPLACANGHAALVELLLAAGADPNTTQRGGETALMTAARTGKVGPVAALLARGAHVEAKERRGQTALMWAAADGHFEVVELLLRSGADLHATLPDSGFTPLCLAVREGRMEAVRVLLHAGADVNEAMRPRKPSGKGPRPGMSPLVLAVENGHFDLAVMLLEAGADPNDQRSGFTALHALSWVRKPNRGDGDDGDPAPIGSGKLSSLQFVRKLVVHGADVNARLERGQSGRGLLTRRGATPFLLAAVTADTPYMRLLVELGADASIPNVEHCTPLLAAAGVGTLAPTEEAGTEPEVLEAVAYCLSLGADINVVDDNGETAMHGAAYKSLPKVVRFLAGHGAKVGVWNQPNKWGWTPLRIAEGYRVGNFKPSQETIDALQRVMLAAGAKLPAADSALADGNRGEYPAGQAKKTAR